MNRGERGRYKKLTLVSLRVVGMQYLTRRYRHPESPEVAQADDRKRGGPNRRPQSTAIPISVRNTQGYCKGRKQSTCGKHSTAKATPKMPPLAYRYQFRYGTPKGTLRSVRRNTPGNATPPKQRQQRCPSHIVIDFGKERIRKTLGV